MLSIYRRHTPSCKFAADRISKTCRCPLWATGTLEGKPYRRTLKTRGFERAEQLKKQIEDGYKPEQPKSITVTNALIAYLSDCGVETSRQRVFENIERYKNASLLSQNVEVFARFADLTTDVVRDFRSSWRLAARSPHKNNLISLGRIIDSRGTN